MVSEIERRGRKIYLCELCGFGYADQSTASECQEWCSTHESCSLEITKKAIYRPSGPHIS